MENKLVAFIVSTSWMDKIINSFGYKLEHGTHNGYVAVPPKSKYHGMSQNDVGDIHVHGGITLSEPVLYPNIMNGLAVREKYVGKRNLLLEKAEFITENTEIGDDWWIFGFDTAHWGDNKYDWDRQAVIEETLSMMEQLLKEE